MRDVLKDGLIKKEEKKKEIVAKTMDQKFEYWNNGFSATGAYTISMKRLFH